MVDVLSSAAAVAPLLEFDPDLAAGVPPEDRDVARQACRVELVQVPRGRWEIAEATGDRDDLVGLVIVEGVVCREVNLRDRCMLELLGPGDALQPPSLGDRPRLGGNVELTAVSDLVVVLLGASFTRAAARWPSLLAAVQRRLEAQREAFAIQALIAHLPKAEHRLLLILCHLSERWGYVTSEGIVLPLALTHDLLGQLVGTRRSTATLALRTLGSEGSVRRLNDGSWLLTRTAERKIDAIARATDTSGVLGERLMLCRRMSETAAESSALRAEATQILAQKRPRRVGPTSV